MTTPDELSELLAAFEVIEVMPGRPAPDMGKVAAYYAERLGWPVFPVHHPVADRNAPYGWRCSCGKDDDRLPVRDRCKSPGKHPLTAQGFKDASADPDEIAAWWRRWPAANIATPTGASGCGFDVIDIDGVEGLETWRAWRANDPASIPPLVALAFTPGNRKRKAGRHWLTPAIGTANTARALPGIDLRGDGGYILLPPSQGITGPRYAWMHEPKAAR